MAIIDILKSSELFEGFEMQYLEKIANLCRGGSFKAGMMIFREGDEATELYLLTDGQVVVEMDVCPLPNRPAIPTAVELVSKGEIFGWSALVEPHIYTLSARCITRCTVLAIKGDLLGKVMADDPSLGYELMKRLAKIIALRLLLTRLRLTSGLGLTLLGKELGGPE